MVAAMSRPALLLLTTLVLAGCPPRVPPDTSGGQEPPTPAPSDPPVRVDPPVREPDCPCPEEDPVATSEDPALPPAPDLAVALRLHDDGDIEGAMAEGYAFLQTMQEVGLDSLSLRLLLGTWALEAGDGVLAEEQFEIVLEAEAAQATLWKQAAAGLSDARALILGPEGAALADARDALERGDLSEADRLLSGLLFGDAEQEVIRQAEALRGQVTERAIERADADLLRAADLLAGPGPYDVVVELLDGVKTLPEGTWDRTEERRLRAWYRSLTKDAPDEPDPVAEAADTLLADARAKVASADYRSAIELYDRLDGTIHQQTARAEAREAADVLVKEEREVAAKLFVAAKKKPSREERIAALVEVRDLLASLARDFPQSRYAERVARNLEVVESELRSEGWEG